MNQTDSAARRCRAAVVLPPLRLSPHFIDYPYFTSLAACQTAAVLQQAGLQVEIVDGLSGGGLVETPEGLHLGETAATFLDRLAGLDAELTVLTASPFLLAPPARSWLRDLIAAARSARPGWLVLADAYVGGMHYLEVEPDGLHADLPGLDLLLRYECEPLLARLASRLIDGKPLPRGVQENRTPFALDGLPPPAWNLLDLEAVFAFLGRVLGSPLRRAPLPARPARTLPLVTARGCPFGCVFCTSNPGLPGDRRQYRAVPFHRVREWVRSWVRDLSIERLVVLDEVANLDSGRFQALLDLADEQSLRLDFPNGLRADLLDEPTVARLAKRTRLLKVSLESASPRVQRELLGKRLDPESVRRVATWAFSSGLPLAVHVMIGIPGETREEIVTTLRMARDLHRETGATPLLQLAAPLPGTELDEICRRQRLTNGPAADPHAGFQGRGTLTTAEFDPDFLERCREALETSLAPGSGRKVIVNLTYRCNNRCVFCAVGDRPVRDAATADVFEAMERYRAAGFELLDLDGGEPTLHPELPEIIAAARRLGFRRVTLISNGRSLAYRGMAERLARAGVDEVLVSLHASDAVLQAELTSVSDSLAQTTRGLRHVLELLGPERVGVNTTVVAANVAGLRPLGTLLSDMGVRRWTLQVVTPFGRARASQFPDPVTLGAALSALLDDPPPGLQIQVINCPPCLLPGHERAASADFAKAERDMVFVGADGENLQGYLATRRTRDGSCDRCPYCLICPGHYDFEEVRASPAAARLEGD